MTSQAKLRPVKLLVTESDDNPQYKKTGNFLSGGSVPAIYGGKSKRMPHVTNLSISTGQMMDSHAAVRAQPKTVLIVEDNELNMKLFHDLLEANGYRVLQ